MKKLLAALLLLTACRSPSEVRRVVVVSVDALTPDLYLSDRWEAPHLKAWAREGAHARGVETVYPSVTYPSHATMITGVRPHRHGVVANAKLGPEGPMREWYWEAADLKARTLWDAAREKNRRVAVVFWPSSVGAPVTWRIPERWPVGARERQGELLMKHSTPGLLLEMALEVGLPRDSDVRNRATVDRFITDGVCYIIRRHRPDLIFVHLIQIDFERHKRGREGDTVAGAVRAVDANLGRIRRTIEEAGLMDETLLVVTGDHGFMDVRTSVSPNVLLAEAGLVELEEGKIRRWKAFVHGYGGSAAVYASDGEAARAARSILEARAADGRRRLFRVVDRAELEALGGNPDAVFALEAEEGVAIGSETAGAYVQPAQGGTHGHLPTREQLRTGFVAVGAGIRPGAIVETMHLADVAPTVAHVLGLEMSGTEGRVLREILRAR